MNPYLSAILENVLPVVALFVAALLSVLTTWVLKKLKEKLGLDLAAAQQKMLSDAVTNGIGLAEKWALNKVKLGESPPAGAEKLDKALEFVNGALKEMGLQEKAKDELVKLVESKLGLVALEKK